MQSRNRTTNSIQAGDAALIDKAGESFYGIESPGECADFLEECRADGFIVPQYAIDMLREEQRELEKDSGKD